MKVYEFEGKTQEEIIEKIGKELNKNENEIIVRYQEEEKSGLFKSKKIEAKVVIIEEVIEYIKEFLKTITNLMGTPINLEVKKSDDHIKFTLYSDNNSILIGKNGRTLEALQILVKQTLYNKIGTGMNIIIDVEGYKEKQHRNIEFLAKRTAREVERTKIEVKLTNMNSYERRIVHSILTEYKGVYTESEGQEPNRYIVVKPKED